MIIAWLPAIVFGVILIVVELCGKKEVKETKENVKLTKSQKIVAVIFYCASAFILLGLLIVIWKVACNV